MAPKPQGIPEVSQSDPVQISCSLRTEESPPPDKDQGKDKVRGTQFCELGPTLHLAFQEALLQILQAQSHGLRANASQDEGRASRGHERSEGPAAQAVLQCKVCNLQASPLALGDGGG